MLMKAMKRVMLDMTKNVSHHDRLHALKEFLKIYIKIYLVILKELCV